MPPRPDHWGALAGCLLDFEAFPGRYPLALREPRLLFDHGTEVLTLASGRALEGLPQDAALEARLRQAARFFVRTALLRPGVDHYTLLGLTPGFEPATLREHYRMLIRLTHPDFAADGRAWPADAATRINQANDVLSSTVSRQDYERRHAGGRQWAPSARAPCGRAAVNACAGAFGLEPPPAGRAGHRGGGRCAGAGGVGGVGPARCGALRQRRRGRPCPGAASASPQRPHHHPHSHCRRRASASGAGDRADGPGGRSAAAPRASRRPAPSAVLPRRLPCTCSDPRYPRCRRRRWHGSHHPSPRCAGDAAPAAPAARVACATSRHLQPVPAVASGSRPCPGADPGAAARPRRSRRLQRQRKSRAQSNRPSMADVQPLLGQVMGVLQSGRGEQVLRWVERPTRQGDGADGFVQTYNRVVADSRKRAPGPAQFSGRPVGEQLHGRRRRDAVPAGRKPAAGHARTGAAGAVCVPGRAAGVDPAECQRDPR